MRVLLWLSRGAEIPGGHRVQLERTAAALAELGVTVHQHFGAELPDVPVDIVHGFQLHPEASAAVRQRGMPLAMSTIYVGLGYTTRGIPGPITPRALLGQGWRGLRYLRQSMASREHLSRLAMRELAAELDQIKSWSMADVLLPNARGEAQHIRDDLGVLTESRVIPNAVQPDLFIGGYDVRREPGTVLCVGRVEPHKNQLALIRAMRQLPQATLTVAGPPHPHHEDYYEECLRSAGDNVRLIGALPHDQLPELYAAHHTHVLPSWYETTGLVTLEAAVSGCSVVTTNRGHAHEYVEDDGFYCDPTVPGTIVAAVKAALEVGPSRRLLERTLAQFTWRQTAEATLAAYTAVLDRRGYPH